MWAVGNRVISREQAQPEKDSSDVLAGDVGGSGAGRGATKRHLASHPRWKVVATVFGCLLVGLWFIGSSESFEKCEHERKHHKSFAALEEKVGVAIHDAVRFKLALACGRVTLGENDGPIVALATIVLAIFTYQLWKSTNRLARSADDQRIDNQRLIQASTDAANAANTSANAALGVELPRLEPSEVDSANTLPLEYAILTGSIKINFRNYGRTTAHLVESGVCIFIGDFLPENYCIPQTRVKKFGIGDAVGAGGIHQFDLTGRFVIKGEDQEAVFTARKSLYFYGFVAYRDFLDGFWITKFCYAFDKGQLGVSLTEETANKDYRGRHRYDPSKPAHIFDDLDNLLS